MTLLIILFLISMLPAQLGGIRFASGATLYIHDIALVALLFAYALKIRVLKKYSLPSLTKPILVFLGGGGSLSYLERVPVKPCRIIP